MNKKQEVIYILTIATLLTIIFTSKVNATTGTVTTETLNLRKEPTTESSILELLSEGDKIEVISEENGWYKVEHNDKSGYVSKDYVEVQETTSQPTETTTPNDNQEGGEGTGNSQPIDTQITEKTVTLEKDAKIRILPLINGQVLQTINAGETVNIITQTNNWLFIETDEITGWIAKNAVSIDNSNNEQNNNQENNTQNNEEQNSEQNENNNENNEEENSQNENNNENNENENHSDENSQEESQNTEENNETTYSSSQTKYVNASSIYVRNEPSTSASVVTTLIKNTDVTVTGESGDWYKVKYNEYEGYIYKELLSDTKTEETNRGTNVQRNENKEGNSTLSEENVTTENNTNDSEIEQTQNSTTLGEQIVEYAKQYLGCPYVYGGSGSSSFDCSGFTMYVYKNFGYSLSHSALAQSRLGTHVEKEDLQLGDLVFFLEYDTMDEIGHCGIYIGEGNFIHASSGTGYCVKISTLTSGSYLTRYATARRLI